MDAKAKGESRRSISTFSTRKTNQTQESSLHRQITMISMIYHLGMEPSQSNPYFRELGEEIDSRSSETKSNWLTVSGIQQSRSEINYRLPSLAGIRRSGSGDMRKVINRTGLLLKEDRPVKQKQREKP